MKKGKRENRVVGGFSLLEALIALTILIIIMATAMPIMAEFYFNYRITTATQDLVSSLRKAQALSMTNQFEDTYGIYIDTDKYILFRGSDFASRNSDFDEEIFYSEALTVSGADEVVFAQLSGRPTATSTITISDGSITKNITINSEGLVNGE